MPFLLETFVQKRSPGQNSQYCGKFLIMKTLKKNEFNFKIYIHKKFLSEFLIKKFDFEKSQIIEVFVD